MQKLIWSLAVLVAVSCAHPAAVGAAPTPTAPAAARPDEARPGDKAGEAKPDELKPEEKTSRGAVTVGGRRIDYTAIAGTLVVHPKGAEDGPPEPPPGERPDAGKGERPVPPAAAMSYVAYLQTGADSTRPVMFLYNGGPGSATVWLHMGAFGPRRVVTAEDSHTPAAPYRLVDNAYSLLDVSDLVFVDAPGTGFGKMAGKDKEKAFWGVDPDADAFADFITQFLSKYGRWNSPKYLFGESYGTTRSAVLARVLLTQKYVDLNAVILLAQILCFDADVDGPEGNPGVDLPYQLALPTYAATAWYHKKLADPPASLEALVADVEKFAMTEYAAALAAGNALEPGQRKAVLEKLHRYTGLPVAYLDKANLRVHGGAFEKNLQDDANLTTGRLDTRFSGPTMDPLSKDADYDPQSASIGAAYVSAFNDYARKTLGVPADKPFKVFAQVFKHWSWKHGDGFGLPTTTNVMPDLAAAMKYNPNLVVQLEAGYFDLATPFYEGVFELQHLPLPPKQQANIEMKFYPSGHMIYANEPSLRALHDNVASLVRRTATAKAK
jgi:carboxypeptidase C (cathepsin A)